MRNTIAALPLLSFISLSLLLLPGCRQEPAFDGSLLPGRWEIAEAFRNGSPTTSLENLYFNFGPDNKVTTNLIGADRQDNYLLDGEQIFQSGGPLNVTYRIEELSANRLILTTTLRNYDFRFVLLKGEAEQ